MTLVKVLKTKAYFKRFQVKYRRRREGKTDYKQRRALIIQDKRLHNAPKYRLAVRLTNTKVIAQVIYATIKGDRIVASASSDQLKHFGVSVGLKNFAAAYCTGLLVARRVLRMKGLDKVYSGVVKADGKEFHVEDHDEHEPFRCILDIGLNRATVGQRVFAVLKGAVDGGLDIPHSIKRFPGYSKGEKVAQVATGKRGNAAAAEKSEGEFDPIVLRDRIFSKHVAEHMKDLKESDPDAFNKQYSEYIKLNITESQQVEALYTKAHAAIRADPMKGVTPAEKIKSKIEQNKKTHKRVDRSHVLNTKTNKTITRLAKLTNKERKERIKAKIARLAAAQI